MKKIYFGVNAANVYALISSDQKKNSNINHFSSKYLMKMDQ